MTRDRRDQAASIIERAIERGELGADADRELALDLLIAPLYWRIIVQRRSVTARQAAGMASAVTTAICGATSS